MRERIVMSGLKGLMFLLELEFLFAGYKKFYWNWLLVFG